MPIWFGPERWTANDCRVRSFGRVRWSRPQLQRVDVHMAETRQRPQSSHRQATTNHVAYTKTKGELSFQTCLVRFDNNKYSVAANAVRRPVEVHAYADRIVIRQDGRIVAEHPRSFGRGETIYDPWHYVLVLARKPGALRRAPFKDWVLPAAMDRVRSIS